MAGQQSETQVDSRRPGRPGVTAEAWMDAGLGLLADHGVAGVTLERLCEQMGLSRGSFYHHFAGIGDYRQKMLGHWEESFTGALITETEALDAPPIDQLNALLELVLEGCGGPQLEEAVRAWARSDSDTAVVQARVDATRLGYVTALAEAAGIGRPATFAQLIYAVIIGAGELLPPLPRADLRAIFALLAPQMRQAKPHQGVRI